MSGEYGYTGPIDQPEFVEPLTAGFDAGDQPDTGAVGAAPAMNGVRRDRYTAGDVNHVLQPVIGWWRLLHDKGQQPDGEAIGGAIDRMVSACESEKKWLALAKPADTEAVGLRARLAALADEFDGATLGTDFFGNPLGAWVPVARIRAVLADTEDRPGE